MTSTQCISTNCQSRQRLKTKESSGSSVVESKEKPFSELTLGEKVQRAGKDATYTGIIIVGVAVTGLMFFAIGRELFSGQSPSGIYSRAVKLCNNSEQVRDAVGEPMKAYGEMNRRGRRRFVRHAEYEVDGVKRMKVQFYVEGPQNKGTVFVDVKQDARGKYQFEYVLLETENFPRRVIVVEDNRAISNSSNLSSGPPSLY
jgi:import inner membrane translocase subunit TIM21